MPNRLPIPKELQHLIEKRQTDDRRQKQRRETESTTVSQKKIPPVEASASDGSKVADGEVTNEVPSRRQKTDRRRSGRRKTDR